MYVLMQVLTRPDAKRATVKDDKGSFRSDIARRVIRTQAEVQCPGARLHVPTASG
jgi:hypothetical protein